MGQRKKALYSEEFQAMLDRLEEEDYADRSGGGLCMRKSRLCIEQVKALERHFEVENRLQPDRKVRIAEELGLEPRQVAIWFQNRRARWKAKQLEREYDKLRASYVALKHDYGSLEQEKQALLSQLKDLKEKIEDRQQRSINSPTQAQLNHDLDFLNESLSNVPLPVSSASSSCRTCEPFSMSSSSLLSEFQLCKAYQNQVMRMEEMGVFSHEESCNFFSVDQAPTLHYWYNNNNNCSDQYNEQ